MARRVVTPRPLVHVAFFVWTALLAAPSRSAGGDSPTVQFDVGTIVACYDVGSAELAVSQPGEKVIAATFRVSVRLDQAADRELEEITIELHSPERRFRILDMHPRTLLESETVGEIEVTKTSERASSLGTAASSSLSLPALGLPVQITPSASLGTSKRDVVIEKQKKYAPRRVILASGTTHEEHGVFFKLKRSTTHRLEGRHDFTVRMIVPIDWRGDWVDFDCRATCHARRYFSETIETCGHRHAYVALYLKGDAGAKLAASRFARAQDSSSEDKAAGAAGAAGTAGAAGAAGTAGAAGGIEDFLVRPKTSLRISLNALTYPIRWTWSRDKRPPNETRPKHSALRELAQMAGTPESG